MGLANLPVVSTPIDRLSSSRASWAGTGWAASRGTSTPQNCTDGAALRLVSVLLPVYMPWEKAVIWSLMS